MAAPLATPLSALSSLLAKLLDKDSSSRRASLDAIKELIHRELAIHGSANLPLFINALLGILDKKSKHHILASSSDESSYSQLAFSAALLLAEVAISATHGRLKLSLPHIAVIIKSMVPWLPLEMGGSPSQSLHQACARLVCSVAENAAVVSIHDSIDSCSTGYGSSTNISDISELNEVSSAFTSDPSELNHTVSSASCNQVDPLYEHLQHCAHAIESLCRPLISALCSKVEPMSGGATVCLEALVMTESWAFTSLSLIEELCFRAFNVMQARTALTVSVAQLSLFCNLAKKNPKALSCFKSGLLKKGIDVLLNRGAWQQRVAAARMIEGLLSMEGQSAIASKHDKKVFTQAVEALQKCRLDKVAMVRSAVGEALKIVKEQELYKRDASLQGHLDDIASTIGSSMKASNVDYRKRRRRKPLEPHEKQMGLPSPALSGNGPLLRNEKWLPSTPSSSNWSSTESVNSSVDVKCPRKKNRRTGGWKGKTDSTYRRNGHVGNALLSTSSSSLLSMAFSAPSPPSSSSYNHVDKVDNSALLSCMDGIRTDSSSFNPHKSVSLLLMEPSLPRDLENGDVEEAVPCPSEEKDCVPVSYGYAADGDANALGAKSGSTLPLTSTRIHYNPIAQLQSLEVVGIPQESRSATNFIDSVVFFTPMSLLLPKWQEMRLRPTNAGEDIIGSKLPSDLTWTVRNNPIATEDSELDSPSPIYCDDGDDCRTDVVCGKQLDVEYDCTPLHGRWHQDGCDFTDKGQHEQYVEDSGGGYVDNGYGFSRKEIRVCDGDDCGGQQQASFNALCDLVVADEEHRAFSCDRLSHLKCSLLEEKGMHLPSCHITTLMGDAGTNEAIACEVSQSTNQKARVNNNQLKQCYVAHAPSSLVSIDEHCDICDNFTQPNASYLALHSEVERDVGKFHLGGQKLEESTSTDAEDVQALREPAIAMEALQASTLNRKGGGGKEAGGGPLEGGGNSGLGWLRRCYTAKKWRVFLSWWPSSPMGALIVALTIPVAIVSIVNIFETREEAINNFLLPT